MSTETRLRDELRAAGSRLGDDHGELGQIMRRGTRRRYRRRGAVAGAITLGAVMVAGTMGSWSLPTGLPMAGQPADAEADMAIYFCDELAVLAEDDTGCSTAATTDDRARVRGALNLDGAVVNVRLETSEQAHERFAELFADQPELVASVEADTLPSSLRITLADDSDPDDIKRRYLAFDGVAQIVALETD